jgi:hypothetical protein
LFETAPFLKCPLCATDDAFGVLHIGGNRVERRCRYCRYSHREALPKLDKKVIYLDQFAFSELFKLEANIRKVEAPSREFWENLSVAVRKVLMLQQAIFPMSDVHSTETLVDKHHKELHEALQRIGGDASFIDTRDVEFIQMFECFEAFCENREPTFDLSVDRVMKGRRNAWLPTIRIIVNTDYSIFADGFRKIVGDTSCKVAKLIEFWRTKSPSFEEALKHELNSYGPAKEAAFLAQISQFETTVTENSFDWVEAAMHPIMREFSELRRALKRAGKSEVEADREIMNFWNWPGNLQQPYHRVGAYLFAALARKVVAGQKSVTPGFANDIRAISSYAPYVDAMFLDRECAALMSEVKRNSQLQTKARIFSIQNGDEFLAYLEQIERGTPVNVREMANSLYGLDQSR